MSRDPESFKRNLKMAFFRVKYFEDTT
jgi:hypothetical protein